MGSVAHVHHGMFPVAFLDLSPQKPNPKITNEQLYDGISVPAAIVDTSVCSVLPTLSARLVEDLLSNVPSSDCHCNNDHILLRAGL